MVLGQSDIHMKKMKLNPHLTPYKTLTQNGSNVKNSYKKTGVNLHDLQVDNSFLAIPKPKPKGKN